MNKHQVVTALKEVALLLELAGEGLFKVRSYSHAARTIDGLTEDLDGLVREGRLRNLHGVGPAMEAAIRELFETGRLEYLEELRGRFPASLSELFSVPGLGPKRIRALHGVLGVDSIDSLSKACEDNRVAALKGFGPKMQARIRDGISFALEHEGLRLLNRAHEATRKLLGYLAKEKGIVRIEVAGSLRRRSELIKDIDLVASSPQPARVMRRLVGMPGLRSVDTHGRRLSRVVLDSGIPVDLHVVSEEEFPFALAHFTGNKAHVAVMRRRARERGLELNESGLLKGDGTAIPCRDEAALYAMLGLPYIPPALREDRGEFALQATPALVQSRDIKGIIHCHTTYSDGLHSIVEMASAAQGRGYQYLLISDHSQSASYAGGMKPDRVLEQHREIDTINPTLTGFHVLKGIESDIRLDGSLDYEEDVLKTFDLIIASVHNKLEMTEAEATARIIKAAENPYTDILGHLTGRLLLSRKGFPVNYEKIMDACVANNTAIEINANCRRLDIDWRHLRRGKEKGVRFAISPDAHNLERFDNIAYGIGCARKGWLEASDILNNLTAKELLAWRTSS